MNQITSGIKPLMVPNTMTGALSSGGQPPPPEVEPPPDPAMVAKQEMQLKQQQLKVEKLQDDALKRRVDRIEKARGGSGRLAAVMKGMDTVGKDLHKMQVQKMAAGPKFTPAPEPSWLSNQWTGIKDTFRNIGDGTIRANAEAYVADPEGETGQAREFISGEPGSWKNNTTWLGDKYRGLGQKFRALGAARAPVNAAGPRQRTLGDVLGRGVETVGAGADFFGAKLPHLAREVAGNTFTRGFMAPLTHLGSGVADAGIGATKLIGGGVKELWNHGLGAQLPTASSPALKQMTGGLSEGSGGLMNAAWNLSPWGAAFTTASQGIAPTVMDAWPKAAPTPPAATPAAAEPEGGAGLLAGLSSMFSSIGPLLESLKAPTSQMLSSLGNAAQGALLPTQQAEPFKTQHDANIYAVPR